MKRLLAIALLCFLVSQARTQTSDVRGRIIADETKHPLAGAYVKLTASWDTSIVSRHPADKNGAFLFAATPFGLYRLEVTYLGYTPAFRTLRIDRPTLDIGDIALKSQTIQLGEVLINATPLAVHKGDTTEYVAGAFKTNRDATTEDLVTKLPGVTMEGGTVKAGGDEVRQVLVDGRPFFGNDPTLALRNLPAETVEKIQVFDKLSEQAEFTGFDDGQTTRTMNIITREDRRNARFGRVYGGYGEASKYNAGGAFNIFNGLERISIIGLANNVNQQNFSMQDILGAINPGGQRGGGGMPGGGFRMRGGRQTGWRKL